MSRFVPLGQYSKAKARGSGQVLALPSQDDKEAKAMEAWLSLSQTERENVRRLVFQRHPILREMVQRQPDLREKYIVTSACIRYLAEDLA